MIKVRKMRLVEKYKMYRKKLMGLHRNILEEFVNQEDFERSARVLGMMENNQVVLQCSSERDILFDFIIYENTKNGANVLSKYLEKYRVQNNIEEKLLNAMNLSNTSLYEVTEINKQDYIISLNDILNKGKDTKLLDIGLSQSIAKNTLVYTRLIKFDKFSMTSGLGFTFSANHKDFLIRRSKKIMKKVKSGDASVDRFIAYFKLYRVEGIPIKFEEIQ